MYFFIIEVCISYLLKKKAKIQWQKDNVLKIFMKCAQKVVKYLRNIYMIKMQNIYEIDMYNKAKVRISTKFEILKFAL